MYSKVMKTPNGELVKCKNCDKNILVGSFRDIFSARLFNLYGFCQECQDLDKYMEDC